MSRLMGFTTQGAIHLVVNNQLGFTTSPSEGRSGVYCTDVAKAAGCPVLHVNGGCADSVIAAAKMATMYWHQFGKDVFLDLNVCRHHGHNEVDEPAFTQPLLYRDGAGGGAVARARGGRSYPLLYADLLVEQGLLQSDRIQAWEERFQSHLESELKKAESLDLEQEPPDHLNGKWAGMRHPSPEQVHASVDTGAATVALKAAALASVEVPQSLSVHTRLQKNHIEGRKTQVTKGVVDWATAEAMAFGTLLAEGHNVRLCGQDSQRGTFSQRHAVLHCQETGETFCPLAGWKGAKGRFNVVNSHLSEMAVLGFEYGYSWEDPRTLCLWEAQFGDFANGAQVIIDQYISGGEAKWLRQSGLVLLLPHGMDGAGPEHSSARAERFLQLCDDPGVAQHPLGEQVPQSAVNMFVCNPSTPANYFHLLRRQQLRDFRKPLVVIAPKVLLRLPEAVSPLKDMKSGTTFLPVLADPEKTHRGIERVLLCSGKVYYELAKHARDTNATTAAIVRLEQLAPFPKEEMLAELTKFSSKAQYVWVQEEPMNAGAYSFVYPQINRLLKPSGKTLGYAGRPVLPTPALGLSKPHAAQRKDMMEAAFFSPAS